MNKIIKISSKVIVIMSSGERYTKEVTDDEYLEILTHLQDDEWLRYNLIVGYQETKDKYNEYKRLIEEVKDVPFITYDPIDHCAYWKEVSNHTLPEDFLRSITDAYKSNDEKALKAYKNFWTLLSLNPDEYCRKNLWWFLQMHGLVVSSSGFFIAYRNAEKTNDIDDEGNPIYTDTHSHTTRISIGHSVSIDREDCDCNSDRECSEGLHVASVNWLKENYFGDTGLVTLVNPYNVVAVPKNSEYGKLRCCEYIPIDYAKYSNGHIIPYDVEQGFECPYAAQAIYEGIVHIEKNKYTIDIPNIPGIEDRASTAEALLNLAHECLAKRNYQVINN